MQLFLFGSAGLVPLMALLTVLAGCGNPVGTPCMIEGDGFHARHDCATKCLSRWAVNCPDGDRILPKVCAGASGCQPGSCPQGQVCYHFDDPFEERSYCVPDNICGALPDANARRLWETESRDAAAAMRSRYEKKGGRSTGATTVPAVAAPAE